jgi:hypothetical protein
MTSINSVSAAAETEDTSTATWFEALARAWGQSLDAQAQKITDLSNALGGGDDSPSQMALLTAEAQRMGFISNSASSSINAVGQALETLARKQ